MPDRVFYRDTLTGRLISEATAREIESSTVTYQSGGRSVSVALSYGNLDENQDTSGLDSFDFTDSKWGTRIVVDDARGSLPRIQAMDFPAGMTEFRVTYAVEGGGRYSKGYASSGWMGPDQWPPSLDFLEGVDPQNIANIVFSRGE